MKVLNSGKNTILAENCSIADTFVSRFKGLMGVSKFPAGSGLLIVPCNSIHMFFMKIPLDIVFLDRSNTVVHLIEDIQPWKISKIVSKAHSVLELPSGTIKASCTCIGDRLQIE